MSDLVKRLRNHALPDPYDEREVMHAPLLREAADLIESLQAENAALREDAGCAQRAASSSLPDVAR